MNPTVNRLLVADKQHHNAALQRKQPYKGAVH